MSKSALVLTLVVAVSPIAMTVCQLTCSAQGAGHHSAASGSACHESVPDPGGVAVKSDSRCQHADAGVILIKALPNFELPSAFLETTELFALGRADVGGSHFSPLSPSPSPPLLLPLRI